MQYEATNPEEYIDKLEPDWRKDKICEIRDMIKSQGPELEEGIEYKMLCYGNEVKNIFHLNAQKNYVSLYVGNITKVDNSENLLTGFNLGKGCIRINKSLNLEETKLEEFISKTIEVWREGGDTDC